MLIDKRRDFNSSPPPLPRLIHEDLKVFFIHTYECLVQSKNIKNNGKKFKLEITILIYQETKYIYLIGLI